MVLAFDCRDIMPISTGLQFGHEWLMWTTHPVAEQVAVGVATMRDSRRTLAGDLGHVVATAPTSPHVRSVLRVSV